MVTQPVRCWRYNVSVLQNVGAMEKVLLQLLRLIISQKSVQGPRNVVWYIPKRINHTQRMCQFGLD